MRLITLTESASNIQQQLNDRVTASSSATFTNKGGNISQWTNNSGYLTSSTQVSNSSYSNNTSNGGYIELANTISNVLVQ